VAFLNPFSAKGKRIFRLKRHFLNLVQEGEVEVSDEVELIIGTLPVTISPILLQNLQILFNRTPKNITG